MRLNLELSLVVLHKNVAITKVRNSSFDWLAGEYSALAAIIIIERKTNRDLAS